MGVHDLREMVRARVDARQTGRISILFESFGFKNGMTPRGLIMYTEGQPGGPLEGEIVFRGMRFTLPPGEDVPPAFFELEHVPDEAKPK